MFQGRKAGLSKYSASSTYYKTGGQYNRLIIIHIWNMPKNKAGCRKNRHS